MLWVQSGYNSKHALYLFVYFNSQLCGRGGGGQLGSTVWKEECQRPCGQVFVALSLCCCPQAFSSYGEHGLLIEVASIALEHRL